MKELKKKLRDMPLKAKMLTVILNIIVILLVQLMILLSVLSKSYDTTIYSYALEELDFFTTQVNDRLDKIEDFCYALALDKDNQKLLSNLADIPDGTVQYTSELFEWKSYIQEQLYNVSYIKNVHFIDVYGRDSLIGAATEYIPKEKKDELLSKMAEIPGAYVYMSPAGEYPYMLSGREIHNYLDNSLHNMGTIILVSDTAKIIEDAVKNMETPHEALIVYAGEYCIYNDMEENCFDKNVISDNQGYSIVRYNHKRYLQCWLKSRQTGWTYINLVPYSQIHGSIMRLRIIIILISVLAAVILFIMAIRFSTMITNPYKRLTWAMHLAETGDFSAARQMTEFTDRKDETGQLVNDFHHMIERIDSLITDNYRNQIIIKDTKYRMLRSQINPHFLYNTLNTINWTIRMKKNDDASRMIVELGNLLRASFVSDGFTTAAEEIGNVHSYMIIQKYRYKKRADFSVEENGDLEQWKIPAMMLQPLVENSINYGVETTAEGCSVTVTANVVEEKLVFTVDDNGPGISAEDLEKIRNLTIKPKGHGIGFKNIVERLRIAYGGKAEITIDSEEGKGTCVKIVIPQKIPEDVQINNR